MNPFAVLLLALIIAVCAAVTGWRLLYQLAWLLVVVTAFGYIWSRLTFWKLSISQDIHESRLQVGDVLRERLSLRNLSFLPKLWLEVRDSGTLPDRDSGDVVSIGAGKEKRWRRRTPCLTRGKYVLGPLTINASDPFGMFQRSKRVGPQRQLLVCPQVVPITDFPMPARELPGGNVTLRRTYQSTPSVTTIRDYVPGDELNKVSWKSTARYQKLMVKEFDLDPSADVWIVLDLNRRLHCTEATPDKRVPPDGKRFYLNSSVEYSVTIAASVASNMLERGRSVGLLTWLGERLVIPPDRGVRQIWKLLEVLAVAQAGRTPPLRDVLAAHQEFFAGNHSLLVITPDTSGTWRSGMDISPGRRAPTTAIYIDGLSFDPRMPHLIPAGDDSGGKVFSYMVHNGDDVSQMFGQEHAAHALGATR